MKNLSSFAQKPCLYPLQFSDYDWPSTTSSQTRNQQSLQSPCSFENFRISVNPRYLPLWRRIKGLVRGGRCPIWTRFKLEGGPIRSKPSKSWCTVHHVACSGGHTVILRNISKEEFLAISKRQREIRRGCKPRFNGLKFTAKRRASERGALQTLKLMIGAKGPSIRPPAIHAHPQLVPQGNLKSDAQAPIADDSGVKKRRRECVLHRQKLSRRKPSRFSKPLPPTPQQPLGSPINIVDTSIQTQMSMLSSHSSLDYFPEEISPISFILYRTTSEIPYPETPYPESPLSNR